MGRRPLFYSIMSAAAYLLFHKDHPLDPAGVNSGAEMATLWLARTLVQLGKRVVVCARLPAGDTCHCGVEFWDLGEGFDAAAALKRARRLGPYHLLAACRALPLIASQDEPLCLSRRLIAHDPSSGAMGLDPKILSRTIDGFICVSAAQRRLLVEGGADPGKCAVIPNGADLELFAAGDPAARDYQKLVFVGALVSHKGIDILLSVFSHLKAQFPTLSLDVYGSASLWGKAEEPFNFGEVERTLPGVRFHGGVPQAEVARAFRSAGLCVIPSRWFDCFPLTAVEAQVSGCPVVGFNVGGIKEAIQPGITGELVEEVSESALIECIAGLLREPSRLKKFSEAALERARPKYSWQRTAQEIIALCEGGAATNYTATGRVGILTTWNQECGLATYARYLVEQLPPDSYLVLSESAAATVAKDEDYVSRCWRRGDSSYEQLGQIIEDAEIGLLHINCHYRFFPQPDFGKFICQLRSRGVKIALHLHSTFTFDDSLRALLCSVDRVIVHTAPNRLEAIANGAQPDNVVVLPHGVLAAEPLSHSRRAEIRRSLGCSLDERIVAAFGFIQPHKGMEAVVEGVAYLKQCGISARGVIAGTTRPDDPNSDGYLNQLKELCYSHGLSRKINFLDRYLSEQEVQEVLAAADVVVMNYHSQYYESSGACSLALGAGAVVAASTAPAFESFGDAVWRMTAGYPIGPSLRALICDSSLREAIQGASQRYCEANSWPRIAEMLASIYRGMGYELAAAKKKQGVEAMTADRDKPPTEARSMRILLQNRPNVLTHRGGDSVVMERIAQGLRDRGVDVVLDTTLKEDPSRYDLVHLFNFVLPEMVEQLARQAHAAGVPYVVTTLYEDVPYFHTRSCQAAARLIEYVKRGQDREWYDKAAAAETRLPETPRFDNSWSAANAAVLLSSGRRESAIIRREFPNAAQIVEAPFGHEVPVEVDPAIFVQQYGIQDFILCVGRIESRKNQLMLLKALEDSDLPVVLVSGGLGQPDYFQAVRQFRRPGKTLILDRLSDSELKAAYGAARVHALASWYELPGLVSLEAAALGCNVVVGDCGSTPDYFGDRAFYCDPAGERSIYNAVMAAYYSPVQPGLREHVQQFTWGAHVEAVYDVYKKVCCRNQAVVKGKDTPKSAGVGAGTLGDGKFLQLLDQGERAARERNFEAAMEALAQAAECNPNSIRAVRALGAVEFAQEHYTQAEKYFRRALHLDDRDPKTLNGMGMCAMRSGDTEEAQRFYLRALESDPYQLVSILQLVQSASMLNRFEELESVLRRYLQSPPVDSHTVAEIKFCLAACIYRQGKISESERLIREVLAVTPLHRGACELREMLRKKPQESNSNCMPQYDERQRSLSDSPAGSGCSDTFSPVRRDSSDECGEQRAIEQELGEIEELKKKKEFHEARQRCGALLERRDLQDGDRERACMVLAETFVLQKDIEKAEKLYLEALSRNPRAWRALAGLGVIAATTQSWRTAEEHFSRACLYKPDYDVALAGIGLCARNVDDDDKAWEFYGRALQQNAENTTALLGYMELGYRLKRLEDVERALRSYLEMHPADLEFIYSLAGCCYALGKVDEAVSEVEKVLLFNPQHKNALELRGMIEGTELEGSRLGAPAAELG